MVVIYIYTYIHRKQSSSLLEIHRIIEQYIYIHKVYLDIHNNTDNNNNNNNHVKTCSNINKSWPRCTDNH